ncbi:MAG: hypothetical protein WA648_02940 [Methylocella sp.]
MANSNTARNDNRRRGLARDEYEVPQNIEERLDDADDDNDEGEMHPLDAALKFCEGKLPDDDLATMNKLFRRAVDKGRAAEDEPPPFKGMPKPGGTMVGDAALRMRVRESEAKAVVAFKASIGDTRRIRVLPSY